MSTLLDPCTDTPEVTLLPTPITVDCYIVTDDEVAVYWQGGEYIHDSVFARPPLKVEGMVCNQNWTEPCTTTDTSLGYEVHIEREQTGLDFTGALLIGAAVLLTAGALAFLGLAIKNRNK